MGLLQKLIKPVYAHCDVPCGIYETDTMRNAAHTCKRMIEKIEALGELDDDNVEQMQQFVRMVHTKEEHASLCKAQIYLLWSDYFKPEHLEANPDLHQTMWQAAKQCGKVKQTYNMEECDKLIAMVSEIETLFNDTKK